MSSMSNFAAMYIKQSKHWLKLSEPVTVGERFYAEPKRIARIQNM
jgi:hypothetical protein